MSEAEAPPHTHTGPPREDAENEPLLGDDQRDNMDEAGYVPADIADLEKPEDRKGDHVEKGIAIISVLIIVITTWVVVLSNNPKALGWFAPHPMLQTLALLFFTYGILTLQPTSQIRTKKHGLARHQVAMLLFGFLSILLGSIFMIYNKVTHGSDHFTTYHAKFGLVALIWIVLQVIVGAASAWIGTPTAKAVYKYHRLSGYLLFPWLLVTVHLGGAWADWTTGNTTYGTSVVIYTILPIITLVSVYARVRPSKMKNIL